MRKAFLQVLCLISSLTLGADCRADGVADFYKGKTIMLAVGYTAGGGYDALARITARHMSRYIPGNPNIVVVNEPGAGTLMLANRLYNVAPRDGTQFGIIARGMAIEPLIGTSNVLFDPSKFTWLGSAANEVSLCVTYGGAAVKTWQDALTTPFTVGGAGSGSDPDVFANVLRNLFGVKDRLVTGYPARRNCRSPWSAARSTAAAAGPGPASNGRRATGWRRTSSMCSCKWLSPKRRTCRTCR